MSISAVGSSNDLSTMLRTSGLSAEKIAVVQKDVEDLQNSSPSISASAAQSLDSESFRKALESRIDSDVQSGKLSAEDGDAVKQALGLNGTESADGSGDSDSDSADAATTAAAGRSARAGGPHGGGGGSGSAEKTEVSRTETVSKGVKTTVILYDDGSTETQTAFTSDPDTKPLNDTVPSSVEAAQAYGQGADAWRKSIEPGTLFDVKA
ncbi:hypothetical protein [Novosphingobium album (ex Hu et al. 2023)]|uniref:Uncharacterized protein n=1 Tax=Novosphingobium album (ex Hu et al. 2023) TaxID=2930093 RepID=A0ABT0AX51_9SPHN|nr:hypothetical protein [Novosphingobium album (ex Hu et al. 2023)]MCJ2177309.1 hypothetical protein [Novosphingobium album (ex Hu et al. 2023)]